MNMEGLCERICPVGKTWDEDDEYCKIGCAKGFTPDSLGFCIEGCKDETYELNTSGICEKSDGTQGLTYVYTGVFSVVALSCIAYFGRALHKSL